MSNESKPGAPSTPSPSNESVSANRRAFMKSVVTGAVAVGVVSTAGTAQAQTQTVCLPAAEMPKTPMSVKLVFNKQRPPTLADIQDLLVETFRPTGCPNCGLGGILDKLDIIQNVSIEIAHMSPEVPSLALVQDAKAL